MNEYKVITKRISDIIKNDLEQSTILQRIWEISNGTRRNIESIVGLVESMLLNNCGTINEIMNVAGFIMDRIKLNSRCQKIAFLVCFNQAVTNRVFRREELTVITETSFNILCSIANGMGIGVLGFVNLDASSGVSHDIVFAALLSEVKKGNKS